MFSKLKRLITNPVQKAKINNYMSACIIFSQNVMIMKEDNNFETNTCVG